MLESDYNDTLQQGDKSSYHHQIANHLDAFTNRDDYPEILVLPDNSVLSEIGNETEVSRLKEDFISRAASPEDPTITPSDLVQLTHDAFQHWIDYNKGKARFLRKDEPYRHLLGAELIPSWEQRLQALKNILSGPEKEQLEKFTSDSKSMSTFTRLLASSCRCIDLVDSGKQIYDPMLVEYMPAIQLIEGHRVSQDLATIEGDISPMFEAYRIRMARYGEIVPTKLNLSDVGKAIKDFKSVRSSLNRLDETIKSISDSDLSSSLADIRSEIQSIIKTADNASKATSYSFWMSGIIWTVASALGAPRIVDKISDSAAAASLLIRQ